MSLVELQHVLVQHVEILGLEVFVHEFVNRSKASALVCEAPDSSLSLQAVTFGLERSAEVLVDAHRGTVVETSHHLGVADQ